MPRHDHLLFSDLLNFKSAHKCFDSDSHNCFLFAPNFAISQYFVSSFPKNHLIQFAASFCVVESLTSPPVFPNILTFEFATTIMPILSFATELMLQMPFYIISEPTILTEIATIGSIAATLTDLRDGSLSLSRVNAGVTDAPQTGSSSPSKRVSVGEGLSRPNRTRSPARRATRRNLIPPKFPNAKFAYRARAHKSPAKVR